MQYWFIYDTTSGKLTRFPYLDATNSISKWNNVPSGCAAIVVADTDVSQWALAQDAATDQIHMGNYTVQNGSLVMSATSAQLLAQSQNEQKASIQIGLAKTLSGGFTTKYNGHTYVSGTQGQLNTEGDLKRFELDSTLTTVNFFTVDADWIPHTQADLQAIFLEGGSWKDAQYAQAQSLTGEINAQTYIPSNPVTWTPATSW